MPRHLEHGASQPGCCHTPRTAGNVLVLMSLVTEVGDQGHNMVPLTLFLKGSVRELNMPCTLWLSVTAGTG